MKWSNSQLSMFTRVCMLSPAPVSTPVWALTIILCRTPYSVFHLLHGALMSIFNVSPSTWYMMPCVHIQRSAWWGTSGSGGECDGAPPFTTCHACSPLASAVPPISEWVHQVGISIQEITKSFLSQERLELLKCKYLLIRIMSRLWTALNSC